MTVLTKIFPNQTSRYFYYASYAYYGYITKIDVRQYVSQTHIYVSQFSDSDSDMFINIYVMFIKTIVYCVIVIVIQRYTPIKIANR